MQFYEFLGLHEFPPQWGGSRTARACALHTTPAAWLEQICARIPQLAELKQQSSSIIDLQNKTDMC